MIKINDDQVWIVFNEASHILTLMIPESSIRAINTRAIDGSDGNEYSAEKIITNSHKNSGK